MSSKGDTFENELLEHVLNNADIALVGDATGLRGSTTPGNLYLSLHTADPGETGNQTTSETGYTGYSRKAIARTGAAWTVTANSASPAADQDFGICTALPGTDLTHFAVGTDSTGTGKMLYYGPLTPNIVMAVNVIPRITTASAITES